MTDATCGLCGEPMPEGEEMFHYHGYSGACPKPPHYLPSVEELRAWANDPASSGTVPVYPNTLRELADEIERLRAAPTDLRAALAESLKLQNHYAELLNMYDGGQRMKFADVDSWLDRLRLLTMPC